MYVSIYKSQGNAITERTFRTYHNILSKYITKENPDFDDYLEFASFCYNTSCHSSTKESPFFLMFGRDPVFCIDQILDVRIHRQTEVSDESDFRKKLVNTLRAAWKCASEAVEEAQKKMKIQYDKTVRQPKICVGDRVLLRNYAGKVGTSKKFQLPWKGIFRVIEIDGVHATMISCISPQAPPKKVYVNQIKKCFELFGPPCTMPSVPNDEYDTLTGAIIQENDSMQNEELPEQQRVIDDFGLNRTETHAENTGNTSLEIEDQSRKGTKYSLRNRTNINRPKRYND